MKTKTLVFALLLNCMAGSAFAACTAPEAEPVIPDGDTATGADMFKAKKEIETYMELAEAYLDCPGIRGPRHDRMVTKMEKVAKKFNGSLRAYKAKA